jgi:UDP-N-acetylglucosamine--dolichyl-phosphate N-acetylglucosaminephosphotransferase
MEILLIIAIILAFLSTLLITPYWIRRVKKADLIGRDVNKYNKPLVSEMGGIAVVAGFLISVLFYIGIKTFYFHTSQNLVEIFALLSTVLIITTIGFIDDILGWKIGLKQWQKPVLCLFAAVPLMVINAGNTTMAVPIIGSINFGWIYPLLLIPIAISGASNGFNMIAGYNGLETGMGIIILSALGILSYSAGKTWLAFIVFCMVFALLAFLIFNKYPAKVFPGNVLTYSVGALIASVAILGNIERAAIILFIPYFIELILKARGKFQKESFAKPNKDNSLELLYPKTYGLEHLMLKIIKKIKGKVYEKDIVRSLWLIEFIIAVLILI